MNMRDDALVKTAEIISHINKKALECDGLVATVGVLDVFPNAFSVVPGQVDFTLQVRDLDATIMEGFVDEVCKVPILDMKLHTNQNLYYVIMKSLKIF